MSALISQPPLPTTSGDEREKLLKLLGITLSDSRLSTVSRILAKDATLSTELVTVAGESMHFAKACVQVGYMRGVDIAQSCGVNISGMFGSVTLLETAISRGDAAAVDHLISLKIGVNLCADTEPPLSRALVACVTLNKTTTNFSIARMLMDAGASAAFPEYLTPPSVMLATASWAGRESEMAKLLGEIKARGGSMDAKSPNSTISPIRLALGAKNVGAVVAFIQLGANTDAAYVGGDIIELAIKNKLDGAVPDIQAAIMSRASREAKVAMTAAIAGASGSAESEIPAKNRRHMPAL